MFYGEKGSLLITGSNGYTIYDLKNNLVKEEMSGTTFDQNNLDKSGPVTRCLSH